MTEGQNRYRASRLVLFISLWLTLFILSVKVSAGWATRSLSLLAESLHTLITSFSTLLSLLAITAPDRPTGREVYGHGKREAVVTLTLAAFLGFACLSLLEMSAQQIGAATHGQALPFTVRVSLPLMQMLGVIVAISLGLALVGVYEARILNSPALRLNASQLLKEVWLTILVLAGLLGVWWRVIWIDLLVGIFLVILVVVSFWRVVCLQLPLLVEQSAIAPEVLAEIARQVGGVTHCYQIRSRGIVGRLLYVQMHLTLQPEFTGDADLVAEEIETAIRERYGPIQATFYIDIDDEVGEPEDAISYIWTEQLNGKSY